MILGGGWNETSYKYLDIDAQPPLDRGPAFGFRLVKNIPPPAARDGAAGVTPPRDYSKEKPAVTTRCLRSCAGSVPYDPTRLTPRSSRVEETAEWRRETVSSTRRTAGER